LAAVAYFHPVVVAGCRLAVAVLWVVGAA
jgi:hypothetical protein